jgi:hypothetical protein
MLCMASRAFFSFATVSQVSCCRDPKAGCGTCGGVKFQSLALKLTKFWHSRLSVRRVSPSSKPQRLPRYVPRDTIKSWCAVPSPVI